MNNKKGFTLVELLAVIAILAILVIIAMPNVLNMFMNAKKSSFVTEAQNVIKQVTNKYIDESLKGNHISTISNDNNPLDLSGNIKYEIEIDSQGNVTSYIISNDSYCISSSKKYNELTKDDVKDDCSYESLHNIAATLPSDFYKRTGRTNRNQVSSITFYSDGRVIEGAEKYDISENQDGSLYIYITQVSGTSLENLFIVAKGKIAFPEDSGSLFSFANQYGCTVFKSNLTSIEFNNSIDTSNVINMAGMFAGVKATSLDLSGFNTSKVTHMTSMFNDTKIENLNVSSFDTSNVIDMHFMFANNPSTTLDLSSFDTEKLTGTDRMFVGCKATVGYVKNEEAAAKFNSSSYKPSRLTFTVK